MTWILRQCPNHHFKNDPLCYADFSSTSGNGKDIFLFNLEDWDLSVPAPASPDDVDVLVLRDPYNTFASRIRKKENWPPQDQRVHWSGEKPVFLWKQHAKEFLRDNPQLPSVTVVNYNQWVVDEAYRADIVKSLNLDLTDNSIDFKAMSGAKSDFADKNYFDRWKLYRNNRDFLRMINDDELRSLSEKIFGPIGKNLPKKQCPI
jgi:hypothetical protein